MKEKREARKRSVRKAHDRKSRKLSEIDVGQSAFFQHTDILGPNTYQVSGPMGGTYRRNRVHMRPTSITPKARDLSPVVPPRVLDVTPLALPEEAPQVCNPPTDPPVVNSQPCSVKENIAPTDSSGWSVSAN